MRVLKIIVLIILLCFITTGCAIYHQQGANIGGAIGGIAGALLDKGDPLRGALIGVAFGALSGAVIADVSAKAAIESVVEQRPVEYRTYDGKIVYRAEPIGYDEYTKCHKVRERIWE